MTAAVSAPAEGTCAREGCAIAAGGACARQFPDSFDCDDFEPYEAEASEVSGSDAHGDEALAESGPLDTRGRKPWRPAEETEPMHSGRALTLEEATQVRRAHPTAVVVPIGEVRIGKTTLLAALFEALGEVAAGGWSFAGSLSLMGFEERSHLAMVASGRGQSDTPRTSRNTSEVLLHLALLGPTGARQDVLLADVSGEHAEGLRLHNDAGDYARLLSAATCVLLMVDGRQLAAPAKRYAELTRARTLFQAIHQNELLPDGVPVLLVATKWDLCSEVETEVTPLLENLVDRIRQGGVASDILRVSARPTTSEAAKGSDPLDALLDRVMVLPASPGPQRGARTPALRPSHAFAPGSAVLRKYVTAAQ